ncbi:hypothetical protein MGMO_174c00180 [Methyloglobulus morosus KoM1]|uniref:Uncharacterized protein n=1 Tax=Methyloglobulus morosus KoM1 TaxID=1116472 RepID=V5BLB6_9GAMM|nr:hypothetical protein [Methyloglobulus morosus]ESS66952.1 hypothetical protein MGMO_174c00180 [Methyloglobulus morosus KoM1]
MKMEYNRSLKVASKMLFENYKDEARILRDILKHQNVLFEEAKSAPMDDYSKRFELLELTKPYLDQVFKTDALKVAFIITTACWLENVTNTLLTLKLDKKQFKEVDNIGLLIKWTYIIPPLVDKFSLSKGGQEYQHLYELINDRNALAHPKPKTFKENELDINHKGQFPKYSVGELDEVAKKMHDWYLLPRVLIQKIQDADEKFGDQLCHYAGYLIEEKMAENEEFYRQLIENQTSALE